MTASTFTRLCKADIPWVHHLSVLTTTLYLLPPSESRTFLIFYSILTFLLDTEALLAALQNPSSPPLIPHPFLPFFGHAISMFWYGARYFAIVNAKTQYPIFTLQTINKKTIVVIDPALATVIQKKSPNLTFYGMILEVTRRLVDFDAKTMEIIHWNLDGEHGAHEGLMHESEEMVSGNLAPGPSLNALSTTQIEQFSKLLNDFVPTSGNAQGTGVEIGLMEFVKSMFTQANAYTIYGPQNPFILHPELVQEFWEYEAGMIGLMADIFPSITSRRSWIARRDMNNALHEFVAKGYYETASPMIQKRVAINLKHGLTPVMAGRSELILLFGILGNAVPTTFWFLAQIFSRPDLLQAIRDETKQAIREENGTSIIDTSILKTKCPLYASTYRETLRHIGNLSSVRLVTGTHTVSAQNHPPYLLQKGDMIQIASGVIHTSSRTWGVDAADFKPDRWTTTSSMPNGQDASESKEGVSDKAAAGQGKTALPLPKNVPSSAFRAFGGGSVLCPGRHFAMTEILGFVSLCVHMFDVVDVAGGVMPLPQKDDGRIPLSVMKPVADPRVIFRRRDGERKEGGFASWRLEL